MLFSGSKVAAAIMATSLEIGKLVSTSFLFKFWKKTKTFLKIYLTISVVILMFITSLGIFGYLTASYQKSSLDDKLTSEKISILESKKSDMVKQIETYKSRITSINDLRKSQESRLSQTLTNSLIARNPIQLQELQTQTIELISKTEENITTENKKISTAYDEIEKVNASITQLKSDSMGKNDIITFKFVADDLGLPMDKIVKWFIILIISVFDPLAICLLLAYNTSDDDSDTVVEKKS
jgi:hypothetical protein